MVEKQQGYNFRSQPRLTEQMEFSQQGTGERKMMQLHERTRKGKRAH
jgi:hypothetical protein